MPFVISQDDEEKVQEQQPAPEGFVITPGEEQEDTSFSFSKDILGPIKEAGLGVVNITSAAAGGGAENMMVKDTQLLLGLKQHKYDRTSEEMQEQGATPEQIKENLGTRPDAMTISEVIDESTGIDFSPENRRQRTTQNIAKEVAEWATVEALMPGMSSGKQLLKWAGYGGLFGLGQQIADEAGGGEGSKLTTGLTFALLPFLLKKGGKGLKAALNWGRGLLKSAPLEGVPKFLSESGTPKALADIELSNKNLIGRVAKTSEENLSKFDDLIGKVAEPSFKEVGTFRAADIEKELIKANKTSILDTISAAPETQKKSWEGIQDFVNKNFKAAKRSYSNLYDISERGAKGLKITPESTYEAALPIYKDLNESMLKAPEEGGIKSSLKEILDTIKPVKKKKPPVVTKDKKLQSMLTEMFEQSGPKVAAETEKLSNIRLSKLMASKRSINRLISRADIIPAPVDLLRPVGRAMKADILAALDAKPNIKKAYLAAENTFKEAQETFNNNAIIKMRESELPEKLTSDFITPSNLEKLKKSTGGNKSVDDLIDRLVVENIAEKSKSVAKEKAKEIREYLGKKGQDALDKILDLGDSLTSPGQKSISRGRVLEDLQKTWDTGARPSVTLDMMKNKSGYNLVKETLNRSPQGRKMWKSLQRIQMEDIISSVIGKDNHIDFQKTKDILSDPHLKSVVKDAMGEEGLKFFSQLDHYGKNMAENLERFANTDKRLLDSISDKYLDKGLKYVLYALAPPTLGKSLLPILGVEIGKRAHKAKLFKILQSPEGQKVVKKLGTKNLSSTSMAVLLKQLSLIGGEADDEE